jgi:hypothetical protein
MLEFLGNAIINFLEKELLAAEPALEALVIAQLEKLGSVIMDFVKSKIESQATLAPPETSKAE